MNWKRDQEIFLLREEEKRSWGWIAKKFGMNRLAAREAWRRESARRAKLPEALARLRAGLEELGIHIPPDDWPCV